MAKKKVEELTEIEKIAVEANKKADYYENLSKQRKIDVKDLEEKIVKLNDQVANIEDVLKEKTIQHYAEIEAKQKDLDSLLAEAQDEKKKQRELTKAISTEKAELDAFITESTDKANGTQKELESALKDVSIEISRTVQIRKDFKDEQIKEKSKSDKLDLLIEANIKKEIVLSQKIIDANSAKDKAESATIKTNDATIKLNNKIIDYNTLILSTKEKANKLYELTKDLEARLSLVEAREKECEAITEENKKNEVRISKMLTDANDRIKQADEDERFAKLQAREAKQQISKLNELRSKNV